MKKKVVKSVKQSKKLPQDTYLSIERELHDKNKKVLDLDNQRGLTEMLNSAKKDKKEG
ncbi:hypothetical protein A5881_003949 [Enterococcus termitis]|nr:hypothetical protein A5881_003827 [Enterococcus termitis]